MTLGNPVRLASSLFCHLQRERTGNRMASKSPQDWDCIPIRREEERRGEKGDGWGGTARVCVWDTEPGHLTAFSRLRQPPSGGEKEESKEQSRAQSKKRSQDGDKSQALRSWQARLKKVPRTLEVHFSRGLLSSSSSSWLSLTVRRESCVDNLHAHGRYHVWWTGGGGEKTF